MKNKEISTQDIIAAHHKLLKIQQNDITKLKGVSLRSLPVVDIDIFPARPNFVLVSDIEGSVYISFNFEWVELGMPTGTPFTFSVTIETNEIIKAAPGKLLTWACYNWSETDVARVRFFNSPDGTLVNLIDEIEVPPLGGSNSIILQKFSEGLSIHIDDGAGADPPAKVSANGSFK